MIALLITCLVCFTCVYTTHSVLLAFLGKAKDDQRLTERRIVLDEAYLALERDRLDTDKAKAALPKARTEMPIDLVARVEAWEDDWAREDERKALMELYAEYGDWDIVRRKYSPSLATAADTTADAQVI